MVTSDWSGFVAHITQVHHPPPNTRPGAVLTIMAWCLCYWMATIDRDRIKHYLELLCQFLAIVEYQSILFVFHQLVQTEEGTTNLESPSPHHR